jgi:uncharacterized DUF497 family protein
VEIEFDAAKSAANEAGRGLPFDLAFFVLTNLVFEFEDLRKDYGEERWVAFGTMGGRLYCCVYTRRGKTIRVISLRKASKKEIRRWQS